ncbi:hypothetical protein, partial [Vibrio cyclitrophicus]|uniref:hypothetical protein n=1 Tax=Vibrio cyclitrophicus TaxID=47951 RepID=UPI001A7E11FF
LYVFSERVNQIEGYLNHRLKQFWQRNSERTQASRNLGFIGLMAESSVLSYPQYDQSRHHQW